MAPGRRRRIVPPMRLSRAGLGWHRVMFLLLAAAFLLAMAGCSGTERFRSESMVEELDTNGGYIETGDLFKYEPL
jgi:hypothetical protein